MTTPGANLSGATLYRLAALAESNDGMMLAEADLHSRGHGDIAGTRQSGHDRMLSTGSAYTLEMLEQERVLAEEIHAPRPGPGSAGTRRVARRAGPDAGPHG